MDNTPLEMLAYIDRATRPELKLSQGMLYWAGDNSRDDRTYDEVWKGSAPQDLEYRAVVLSAYIEFLYSKTPLTKNVVTNIRLAEAKLIFLIFDLLKLGTEVICELAWSLYRTNAAMLRSKILETADIVANGCGEFYADKISAAALGGVIAKSPLVDSLKQHQKIINKESQLSRYMRNKHGPLCRVLSGTSLALGDVAVSMQRNLKCVSSFIYFHSFRMLIMDLIATMDLHEQTLQVPFADTTACLVNRRRVGDLIRKAIWTHFPEWPTDFRKWDPS